MAPTHTPHEHAVVGAAPPWHILIVCTGNLCRSPMAQYLAAALLQAGLGTAASGVIVTSAGTRARDGTPMHPHAASVLAGRGLDPRGFATRRLDARLIGSADLVLCAEREHRATVVTAAPKVVSRTFTLREFARVTAGIKPVDISPDSARLDEARPSNAHLSNSHPDEALVNGTPASGVPVSRDRVRMCCEALVARALARRGLRPPADPADADIPDPIGSPVEAFRLCAEQISDALAQPLELLARAVNITG